jgi:hypothetical protein
MTAPTKASSVMARYPVPAFFVIAYAVTWALIPLVRLSPLFGLLALFGPAFAAFVVTAGTEGRPAARALLRRVVLWRVGPLYYVLAFAIPIAISFLAAAIASLWEGRFTVQLNAIPILGLVVFVLVVGEEIGWRGYAQPALAKRLGPVPAALTVGFLWAFWHLPLFYLDGMPQRDIPFATFLLFTMAYSVVAAWLVGRANGSLLIATLLHGAFNAFTFVTPGLDTGERWWIVASLWVLAAIIAAPALARQKKRRS